MIDAPPASAVPVADAFGRPYAALSYGGRPGLVRAGSADGGAMAGRVGAPRRKGRVTAVTWSGQAAPGDLAATQLLDAVRRGTAPAPVGGSVAAAGGAPMAGGAVGLVDSEQTQPLETMPGWDDTPAGGAYRFDSSGSYAGAQAYAGADAYAGGGSYGGTETYGGSRPYGRGAVPRQPHGWSGEPDGAERSGPGPLDGGSPDGGSRDGAPRIARQGAGQRAGSARSQSPLERARPGWQPAGALPEHSAGTAAAEENRHVWQPGRRVDLGLVLLPLRVLLGSLSVYAGFSKLCDPVYFDGGARGSMMRWLGSLHPWKVAQPLLDFAMAHPVGAGLGVAFTEVVVGVLSLLGLWQRLAAGTAMVLSAALLFTVSWRAVPVYDTPDLIFLAAWSPLLIAGAPFASLDGRLTLEAWRRYGPQQPRAVRRRVLRRGSVVAVVVIGLTLLLGSLLGAAVRTGGTLQPGPAQPSTDYGTPVWPAATGGSAGPHAPGAPAPGAPSATKPSAAPSASPSGSLPPSAPPSPSPTAKSGKAAHPSPSGRGGASEAPAAGSQPGQGGSTAGSPAGAATPAGSAGSAGSAPGAGGSTGSSSSTRAPKPAPSGDGLIGGVLGSGAPSLRLPTSLGMPAGDAAGGSPTAARPVV
ncbi:DoxX family protein [Kitasatospora sp. NBC_01302]|uniref:DoxX family protein n=1 Tax=Kitasatospora sp. NBC_01302 TaxID=2903575 RepID=UPI002E14C8BA|nr:DoxX family membrane protein [Kitasatospora sp. NBC_01302]